MLKVAKLRLAGKKIDFDRIYILKYSVYSQLFLQKKKMKMKLNFFFNVSAFFLIVSPHYIFFTLN